MSDIFDGNWQCKCGWMVSNEEYTTIIFDAPCPKCERKFSTFHRWHTKEMKEDEGEDSGSTEEAKDVDSTR